MKHFLAIALLLYSYNAFSAATPSATPDEVEPIKPSEPIESFIDKGGMKLPVAPELTLQDAPEVVLPVVKPEVQVPATKVEPTPDPEPTQDAYVVPQLAPAPAPTLVPEQIQEPKKPDLVIPRLPPVKEEMPQKVQMPAKNKKYTFSIPMPKIVRELLPKPAVAKDVAPVAAPEKKTGQMPEEKPTQALIVPPIVAPVLPKEKKPEPVKVEPVKIEIAPTPKVAPPIAVPPKQVEAPLPVQPSAPKIEPKPVPAEPVVVRDQPHTDSVKVSIPQADLKPKPKPQLLPQAPSKQATSIENSQPAKQVIIHVPEQKVIPPKPIDPELAQFLQNEVIMLSMPDDDVVLGKLTLDAKFHNMSYSQYLSLYERYRDQIKRSERAEEIVVFIDDRRKINGDDIPILSNSFLFSSAVNSIKSHKIEDLRVLSDNYKTLHLIDDKGNSLLHVAASMDEANITKWLIMRGANIYAMNYNFITPRDIAEYKQYWGVFNLLEAANAR